MHCVRKGKTVNTFGTVSSHRLIAKNCGGKRLKNPIVLFVGAGTVNNMLGQNSRLSKTNTRFNMFGSWNFKLPNFNCRSFTNYPCSVKSNFKTVCSVSITGGCCKCTYCTVWILNIGCNIIFNFNIMPFAKVHVKSSISVFSSASKAARPSKILR